MQQSSQALVSVPFNPIEELSPEAKLFYQFHGVQMIGSEFPTNLVEALYLKLTNQAYDGGQFFQIMDNGELETFEVRAKTHIPAKGNVFLIDHTMTFRYPQLRQILQKNPTIIERLQTMLKYQQQKKLPQEEEIPTSEEGEELEFDNLDLIDISALEFPKTLITLSLINNRLESPQQIINKLQYLNLRVLWLNGNSVAQNEQMIQYVNHKTRIQMFNSKFTKNCTAWGLKFAHFKSVNSAGNIDNGQIFTLNIDDRNIFNIDSLLFQAFVNLRSISLKGHEPSNEKELAVLLKIISIPSLRYIYVDEPVQKQLRQAVSKGEVGPSVIQRVLINKHSLKQQLKQGDERLDSIYNKIFRIAGCYRLASSQKLDQSSCWYINDELGSYIPHSDNAKVKLIPFLYAPKHKVDENVAAYTLMWPIEDLQEGDLITRDYLNGIKEEKQRSDRLAAWYQLSQSHYSALIQYHDKKMLQLCADSISLLQKFYGANMLKQKQSVGNIQSYDNHLAVISDYEYINKFLKHERFDIVSDLQKADIVWITAAADEEEWIKYKGKYFLNQFPFQSCIVMKQNLADTVQSVFGDTKFLMRTYNLQKELNMFIGDYYQRQKQGQDNLWILKPPNMARSMDMIITDNLPLIIRAMETGPKIAQKYISNPVLRRGKKVDLRYILLVKSISPLTLFLYKNFWIRSANYDYTIDRRHLSTYETQFTVMNYGNVTNFQQIKYKQFIEQFQKDYKTKWTSINDKIKKMLRNVFIAVGTKYPQMHDDKSRAVYGIDIMIDAETMEPKLLEITFSPDCKRACEYYPTFYDEIFQTLFLQEMSENMERII